LLVVLGCLPVLTGCRDGTVRLSFRPAADTRSVYRILVRATTVTDVGDEPPRRTRTETAFVARQRVLGLTPSGATVEVGLREEGGSPQRFVVRLDRAAQLFEVQTNEGLPARALGELGLSEIFPAAAAAPPDKSLAPGERWSIDTSVLMAGPPAARLVGRGRLMSLGRLHGRDVARVRSQYRLPVRRSAEGATGRVSLGGTQATVAEITYAIDDGTVVSAKATTRGSYAITVFPPPGSAGSPVPGTLTVEVTSTTERLGP